MIFCVPHRIARDVAPLAVLAFLAACAGSPAPIEAGKERHAAARQAESLGQKAASIALRQVGVPYRYGGSSPRGFDCSGLVHYAYLQAGKRLPRTTGSLWQVAEDVDRRELRAGDILFFRIEGKMSHVGLYVGDGRFVHSPSSGRYVSVESLNSEFYADALLRAGRPR